MKSHPCNICSSTDVKLVDGFYYCIECGTQDTTAQETIIERTEVADGVFAIAKTKTIRKKKEIIQMSDEWHKWHAYNFMLSGLADELVALGAKPSFKSKALWIWSRFIQKYKKEEKNEDKVKKTELLELEEDKSVSDDDNEEDDNDGKNGKLEHVKLWHIVTILYLALNLDQSHIKLSDLKRFIREGRLNVVNWKKYVPLEFQKKSVTRMIEDTRSLKSGPPNPRFHHEYGYSFCQNLNLGTVLIPDVKEIVNIFIKELCLPKDFRNLVHSLLECIPFKNMIRKSTSTSRRYRLPDFETIAMAYILVALKMCFGLDDDYEEKLSDAVDEINEKENHLKSYRIGISEPTDRLFSFRDWIAHLEFRKIIVSKYFHPMALENCIESDNHLAYDCYKDLTFDDGVEIPGCKLAHELLTRIPQKHDFNIIHKKLFPASVTPITTYTEFILPKINDTYTRLLLSEDFSRYSLKYACQKLNLKSNVDDTNIIIGVSKDRKASEPSLPKPERKKITKKIFIKDTDNTDWINDYQKIMKGINNQTSSDNELNENGVEFYMSNRNHDKFEQTGNNEEIRDNFEELDEGENIFSENLQDLPSNKNVEFSLHQEHVLNFNVSEVNSFRTPSSAQCMSPISNWNGTVKREEVIKELIYEACRNYKIPIPIHYQVKAPRKKKIDSEAPHIAPKRRKIESLVPKYPKTNEVATILATYNSIIQSDLLQEDTEAATDALSKSTKSEISEDVDKQLDMSVVEGDMSPKQQLPKNPNSEKENENLGGNSIKEIPSHITSVGECYEDDPTITNILENMKLEDLNAYVRAKKFMPNKKKYDQLIETDDHLNEYNYFITNETQYYSISFEKKLVSQYPNSYRHILKTCASLIEVPPWYLYRHLQSLELLLESASNKFFQQKRVSKHNSAATFV